MNDLETRLRDALGAAARIIPDHATGPGLEVDGRIRRRPARRALVALGAAAAVVVVITVPLAIQAGKEQRGQGTAGTPCPLPAPVEPSVPTSDGRTPYFGHQWADKLPVGAPPRIPYTLTDKTGAGYLQDGNVRIPLAAGKRVTIIGRLDCGLLVTRGPLKGQGGELGILKPDGSFIRRSTTEQSAALSPDRTKIAVVPHRSRRLSVIDLASGTEAASRTVAPQTGAYAWTSDGIWYADEHYHEYAFVWRPGQEPRKLTHSADELLPRSGTDLIVLAEVGDRCTDILKLTPSGDATDKVMERCGQGEEGSMLSPDGRFLVTEGGKAFRVPDNTPTGYSQPAQVAETFHPIGFDGPQQILLNASYGGQIGIDRHVIVRCDLISGDCERILDTQRPLTLSFGFQY